MINEWTIFKQTLYLSNTIRKCKICSPEKFISAMADFSVFCGFLAASKIVLLLIMFSHFDKIFVCIFGY